MNINYTISLLQLPKSFVTICRQITKQAAIDGELLLAVVIPVFAATQQALDQLVQGLEALSNQTRQVDLVVIVDDGGPLAWPAEFAGDRLVVLRIVQNCGPAVARNLGVRLARDWGADVVCFMDADCLPDTRWLQVMEKVLLSPVGLLLMLAVITTLA